MMMMIVFMGRILLLGCGSGHIYFYSGCFQKIALQNAYENRCK